MRLIFPAPLLERAHAGLLADGRETCAAFFATRSSDRRWIVHGGGQAPDSAYVRRTPVAAELTPAYLVELSNRARRDGSSIIFAHTHPKAVGAPRFSAIDDDGEAALASFASDRLAGRPHFAMVVGPEGLRARYLGAGQEVRVDSIGPSIVRLFDPASGAAPAYDAIHDRQARAFGPAGQYLIQDTAVAVVGVGGTGSIVCQELAHLGVKRLILIDPDYLEGTNLNRVVAATARDVGRLKVDVAADGARKISQTINVEPVAGDVVDAAVAQRLAEADFIFICTDSHASRAVVGQFAYQHLVPTIDVGVGIAAPAGKLQSITGRAQALAPGLACLVCTEAINSNEVRKELMNPQQRAADPYFSQGQGEPQPAVISLNATMSSLAVTMFLSMVTGVGSVARHQFYDGLAGAVRPVGANPATNCLICSASGALAKGETWPLPQRAR